MNQNLPVQKLHIGAAYYPEHWAESSWQADIRLMKSAGLNVVRMAEFAWSSLEPSAGCFNFDWLDRAIEQLAEASIESVLGTPTAAPPAWLAQQYPELMALNELGRRVQFGNRCHYCVNSPELHQAAREIVQAMAIRFGSNPQVIGWQIDNEFNRVCYCDRCKSLFQEFLAEKYGSLDTLNQRWSTAYWSQTYTSWDQIPMPIGPHNPALMLEFKHFTTLSYRKFQKLQIDALRPHLHSDAWITHNFMGWYGGFDHYDLAADLDRASWDWYVGSGHNDFLASGAVHDLTRGYTRRSYWLMETQPGNVNWAAKNTSLNQGEGRAMAWHAIAHGAEAVLYWQWRSALGGQEQYHGTLIDQSGQPRPFYGEVRALAKEIHAASDLLAGSKIDARVALLNSYDSRWSIEFQRHQSEFDYVAHFNLYYRALAANHTGIDVISADATLDGYKLVVAPALIILNEQRVENLTNFVRGGGHLVLTIRTGMKDPYNALLPSRQPGALSDLAGVEVEDYYALDELVPVEGEWLSGTSQLWAERLKPIDLKSIEPIARFGKSNGWLDGQVAIAAHPYGKGMVYTVGAYLDVQAQQKFLNHVLQTAGIPLISAPEGVEVAVRTGEDASEILIVINHTREDQKFTPPFPAHDQLTGNNYHDEMTLKPYDVFVLTKGE